MLGTVDAGWCHVETGVGKDGNAPRIAGDLESAVRRGIEQVDAQGGIGSAAERLGS